MGARHVKPQFRWTSPSGRATSITGRCADSEFGLTGQHGRPRGRLRSDLSEFVIFVARSLTSVSAKRRPLTNLALFLLQNGVIVCDGTLPIRPWHPNTLLRARSR